MRRRVDILGAMEGEERLDIGLAGEIELGVGGKKKVGESARKEEQRREAALCEEMGRPSGDHCPRCGRAVRLSSWLVVVASAGGTKRTERCRRWLFGCCCREGKREMGEQ